MAFFERETAVQQPGDLQGDRNGDEPAGKRINFRPAQQRHEDPGVRHVSDPADDEKFQETAVHPVSGIPEWKARNLNGRFEWSLHPLACNPPVGLADGATWF
ncbi:MAG: hypothetical protein MnENMB40S_08610 [Rhizobiaceae bacterium MnEN-MB40S]|nr:MAG: hypothetical protein MnENMB40S_08610 [Rhizobiaceae bacterium MnEN-MB40S]